MKRAIKMTAFTVCIGAMMGFAGCGNGDTPESVALEKTKALMKVMWGDGVSLKVGSSKIDGDKGVVVIDFYENGKNVHKEKVGVLKKDGKWTVVEEVVK